MLTLRGVRIPIDHSQELTKKPHSRYTATAATRKKKRKKSATGCLHCAHGCIVFSARVKSKVRPCFERTPIVPICSALAEELPFGLVDYLRLHCPCFRCSAADCQMMLLPDPLRGLARYPAGSDLTVRVNCMKETSSSCEPDRGWLIEGPEMRSRLRDMITRHDERVQFAAISRSTLHDAIAN